MILLNPGPVTMTHGVRAGLAAPDMCHREPEFAAIVARVRTKIAGVYDAKGYRTVLLGGAGTAAVETMLSLVPRGGDASRGALVVANGVYGERMAAMLAAQGKAYETIASPWAGAMNVAAVEQALPTGRFSHVLAVHHETTTGRLNDLPALGALCAKARTPLLLDAVSSFAGERIDFEGWNVEALAATANKCIHGAPGVAFVLARESALARPSAATSVYLDVKRHADAQAKGTTPFTLPTHVTCALDVALDELAASGGWAARNATYLRRSGRVREVLAELGVKTLLDAGAYSSMLTSFRLPEGQRYEALHAHLKNAGFVAYSGQGVFDGEIFRIAVMGEIAEDRIERLTAVLRTAFPLR